MWTSEARIVQLYFILQPRGPPHHHHHVHNTNKSRKLEMLQGEASNPLLASINRSQHQQQLQQSQPHYTTRHRTPSDHHHVSLNKGLHPDEHILQNVHMV